MDEVSHQVLENNSPARRVPRGEVAIYYTVFLQRATRALAVAVLTRPFPTSGRLGMLLSAMSVGSMLFLLDLRDQDYDSSLNGAHEFKIVKKIDNNEWSDFPVAA
jgi:hypothetical protein